MRFTWQSARGSRCLRPSVSSITTHNGSVESSTHRIRPQTAKLRALGRHCHHPPTLRLSVAAQASGQTPSRPTIPRTTVPRGRQPILFGTMLKWLPTRLDRFRLLRGRVFSTNANANVDSIDIPCGSSGHIGIDLHNISGLSDTAPLLVHLPAFPVSKGISSKVPGFLQGLPVVSINYRWDGMSDSDSATKVEQPFRPASWPSPVHDAAHAYSWLSDNLSPTQTGRRPVYVYGSYLGASIASSLALTQSHSHSKFGVKGFMTYNGIFNWTMFLPDHRVNRPTTRAGKLIPAPQPEDGSYMQYLQECLPMLFGKPEHLFDAFASPSLLFHSPGLLVPRSFSMTLEESLAIDALSGQDEDEIGIQLKQPRKSHLVFPPRKSTLKIPEALLLHDSTPRPARRRAKTTKAKSGPKPTGNSFGSQALELADLMRRSIEMVEIKERSKWDEDMDGWENEADRRVQTRDIGNNSSSYDMNEAGQQAVLEWLHDRGVK